MIPSPMRSISLPGVVSCMAVICALLCVPYTMTLVDGEVIKNQVKSSFASLEVTAPIFQMTPTTPEFALQYPSIEFVPSPVVGPTFPTPNKPNDILEFSIMLPHIDDDISACAGAWKKQNEFNQSFVGKFVLLLRSSCSPVFANMAAASGAAGLIVQGCSSGPPANCDPRRRLDYTFVPLGIPYISISYDDGDKMRSFLTSKRAAAVASSSILSSDALQVEVIGSGPMITSERQALIDIMDSTVMGLFGGGAVAAALPDWSKARFSDPTIDPCMNRPTGIWCERGRMVFLAIAYHDWATPKGIPAEFGTFTQLRMFAASPNFWWGPMPDSFCALTELRILDISDQVGVSGVTSLPNCVWPKLTDLRITGGGLTTLPSSIGQMTTLKIISMSGNKITQVPSFAAFDQLSILNFGENQISGTFPLLHPSAPITKISFSNNKLSGVLPINTFDGRTGLTILDLNHNQFGEGPLPTLSGCTKLIYIDLSSQRPIESATGGFTGSLPSSWLSFKSLTTLFLQENNLVSPMGTGSLKALTDLDLSHNRLTLATAASAHANFNDFIYALLPSTIVNCRISYNLLAGDAFTIALHDRTAMRLFWVDHNQLTGWIDEMLHTTIVNVDMSYNDLNQTNLWSGVPSQNWLRFNIEGNPRVRLPSLPSWMVVDSTKVRRPGDNFACSPVKSNTAALMTIVSDPTLYDYKYCECNSGTFGHAPLCSVVPNSADLHPFHMISSDQIGNNFPTLIQKTGGVGGDLFDAAHPTQFAQGFADSMYGEDRMTLGLSTSWVIDLTDLYSDDFDSYLADGLAPPAEHVVFNVTSESDIQPRWTPVRVITVRLHISAAVMTDFDDVLAIYEGAADLKGNRVQVIRGTDTKPSERSSEYTTSEEYINSYNNSISKIQDPRLIEVQVFSPIATVQFTSHATSGLHFFATYEYSFECPDGDYFYDTLTDPDHPRCRVNYARFSVSSGIRSAVFAIAALAMAWVGINIVLLLWNWNSLVFKAASRSFMLLVLIFLLGMAIGSLLYAAVPDPYTSTGDAVCIGRAWLTCLPLAGVLAVLLAKTNRLNAIFGAKTLQVKVHTDIDILVFVLVVTALQIVLLGVFSGLPLSTAVLELGHGGSSDRLVTSCNQQDGFMSWFGAEIAFIACLILPAAYLGFKTRDLPSQYNESTHIQNAITLLLFFGIIIIPLDIFIQDDPGAAVLIQGLGQAFLCILLTTIIFGPKLYHLTQHGSRTVHEQTQMGTTLPDSDKAKSHIGSSMKSEMTGGGSRNEHTKPQKSPKVSQPYPATQRPSVASARSMTRPVSLTQAPIETSTIAVHLTPQQSPLAKVDPNSQPLTPIQLPAPRLSPTPMSRAMSPSGNGSTSRPITPNPQASPRRIIQIHTHTSSPELMQTFQNALANLTPKPRPDTSSEAPV